MKEEGNPAGSATWKCWSEQRSNPPEALEMNTCTGCTTCMEVLKPDHCAFEHVS